MCHFSCRDIKYSISLELEIELDTMTDKFTQNFYAYPDGGVETIQLQNYFPRGTVNSTSDFLLCCMEFDTCVGNNICKAPSVVS